MTGFPMMRRSGQEMTEEGARAILMAGEYGVLAVEGEYPYAVPLNYAAEGNKIYFHCAREGAKLEALRRNPRASFCVVGRHQVARERFTAFFESVIAFGQVRELRDEVEKLKGIRLLNQKYCEGLAEPACMTTPLPGNLNILEMTVEHLTGKVCKEWR